MRCFSSKKIVVALGLVASLATGVSAQAIAQDGPLVDLGAEMEQIKKQEQPAQNNQAPVRVKPVQSQSPKKPTATDVKTEKSATKQQSNQPVDWGYAGKNGPRYWGDLSPEFATCKNGRNQSPIDLRDAKAVGTQGLADLDIRYRDVPLKVENNGHTVQVNYPLGSYIKVGGKRYELLQYHFHTPSEHKKEGFHYPMELHMVHRDGDGNFAVIGVIFQEGEENDSLNTLLKVLPKKPGKQKIYSGLSLNPVYFIPANTEFYKYSGSLTTPPCTEGVYWMVFKQPISASAEQIQQMNEVLGENSRPVNPVNARTLLKSWSEAVQQEPMYEYY